MKISHINRLYGCIDLAFADLFGVYKLVLKKRLFSSTVCLSFHMFHLFVPNTILKGFYGNQTSRKSKLLLKLLQ